MNILRRVRNDSGITLIEAMLSLFTLAFILSFIPLIIKFFHTEDTVYVFDFDLFVIDLMETYKESDTVSTNDTYSMVTFTTDSGNISYRLNTDRVIKSIDGTGFITMLYNVEHFFINETSTEIHMEIREGHGIDETFTFQK